MVGTSRRTVTVYRPAGSGSAVQTSDAKDGPLSLRDHIRVLRKRWRLVAVVLAAFVLAGVLFVLTSPRRYQATAQIFVSTAGADTSTAAGLASGNTFTQARVQSYTSLATSPTVTDEVVRQLGLAMTSNALAREITADAPLNRVLINLHVEDADAEQAAQLANAVAARFSTVVQELEQTAPDKSSPVKLTVTQPAEAPAGPVSPRADLDVAIAILLGLGLGLGLAFLREMLENTVKDPAQLAEHSGLPVLGVVPRDKRAPDAPISFRADAHGGRAEAFRQLRTNLQFVDVDSPPRIIAVTSALSGEGKTHTAMNLAAALAESGQRVCLIEADLRRPSMAEALGVIGEVGLTTVLIGRATVESVLQSAGTNLVVLASGAVPPNPSELISSDAFARTLSEIAEQSDVVVIDTAPLLPVADGSQVAALADATLLTVRAAKTTRDQIDRAVETLGNVGVTPVGVVLSMAPRGRSGGYSYYYQDYRPAEGHPVSEPLPAREPTPAPAPPPRERRPTSKRVQTRSAKTPR
jgi:capsular exopolysaccharide synthesis family protein